jgi:parallel beta-helix repeat protein
MKKLLFSLFFILLIGKVEAQELSGDYYIPNQSAGQNGYSLLSDAIYDLNNKGMSGNVTFHINADITETDDIRLGVNTQDYTLTIKPAPGASPTINLQQGNTTTGDATVITGAFIIGSPVANKTNMVYTNNLVIDGSNTEDGTTRDMIIQGPVTTNQKSVIAIFGDNDNVMVKNCVIINNCSNQYANACFIVTNYVTINEGDQSVNNFSPDNLTIQNNELYSLYGGGSDGIYINNNGGTPTTGMVGLLIEENIISSAYRGIRVSYTDEAKISGNTISVNQVVSNNAAGIILEPNVNDTDGTIDICNNKLINLSTLNINYANNNGIMGIDCEYILPKTVNIYNNTVMMTGPTREITKDSRIYGIRSTGNATCNIYHNTIYIPEMMDMNDFARSSVAGIVFGGKGDVPPIGGFTTVKNNIVIGEESLMKYWCILRLGNSGVFTSENNIFYCATGTNGYIGAHDGTDTKTLDEWRTESRQDANSKSKHVNFEDLSTANLLLTGISIGDTDLGVNALPEVTKDILGNERHTPLAYAGAHEPNDLNSSSILLIDDIRIQIITSRVGIEVLMEKEAEIRLYSINGALIDKARVDSKYVKNLNAGVYIIQIESKVFKFVI